jgi:hypothetical protein
VGVQFLAPPSLDHHLILCPRIGGEDPLRVVVKADMSPMFLYQ